jgi:hypothetical protein
MPNKPIFAHYLENLPLTGTVIALTGWEDFDIDEGPLYRLL